MRCTVRTSEVRREFGGRDGSPRRRNSTPGSGGSRVAPNHTPYSLKATCAETTVAEVSHSGRALDPALLTSPPPATRGFGKRQANPAEFRRVKVLHTACRPMSKAVEFRNYRARKLLSHTLENQCDAQRSGVLVLPLAAATVLLGADS